MGIMDHIANVLIDQSIKKVKTKKKVTDQQRKELKELTAKFLKKQIYEKEFKEGVEKVLKPNG